MESFQELELPEFLRQALKQMNFVKPTPVQAEAIPAALQGKDVIASAQTGTGKTGAFGIPLLAFLDKNPEKTALILTPTRELAVQVLEVLRKLAGSKGSWGSVLLIGGANMGAQLSALMRKPRMVIGTPGRVIDHLNRGSLSLGHSGFLVLDEADRMLDMGFAPQLEMIRSKLSPQRQTLLFSATIPQDIKNMASRYLKDPVRISVGPTDQPISKIAQMVIHTSEAKKPDELVHQLNERQGSILVFARTQNRVDRITERLKDQGMKVTRIHGGRSQSQRRQAIDQFREGKFRILVATDIAARGLDIHHIAHVINYDLPRNPEDYVHRVGRTARAGAEGASLCFLTQEDRGLWENILRLMGVPRNSIEVKASKFGDFTPKHSDGPHGAKPPFKKHGPPGRPGERKFSKPFVDKRGHHPRERFESPRRDFQPSAPQFQTAPKPFDREGGRPKERHPEGRHQKRSENHQRKFQTPGQPRVENNSTSSMDDEKQPMSNESRNWAKPEGFSRGFGQKFGGRPQGQGRPDRPFRRDSRPGFQRDQRPSGQDRHFGHKPAGAPRPFSNNRPFDGTQRENRAPGERPIENRGNEGARPFQRDNRFGGERKFGTRPEGKRFGGPRPGGDHRPGGNNRPGGSNRPHRFGKSDRPGGGGFKRRDSNPGFSGGSREGNF